MSSVQLPSVGDDEGEALGDCDGNRVGLSLGLEVGLAVGDSVGDRVGLAVHGSTCPTALLIVPSAHGTQSASPVPPGVAR